ncbi:PIG-X [Myxozyma melibiosi]|uniref:Protein PBN1 n=1 Tax=Myxozyma melibiosi TaxID=54550 RepID=A0ABR1F7B4_9ASCO
MAAIRQRHTFIVHDSFRDTPETLSLTPESLEMKTVPGARQDRYIVSKQLVKEKEILDSLESVRIEIGSSENYAHLSPFDRTIQWGTHITVVPVEGFDWNQFCKFVNSAISPSIPCIGQDSFISLPFGYYLYSTSTDLAPLISYLETTYPALDLKKDDEASTAAIADPSDLLTASSISISFSKAEDTVRKYKGRLVTEIYWQFGTWSKTITPGLDEENHKVEVGFLGKIKDDPEGDVAFGGILAVIGENSQFVPTLFDFAPRHRGVQGTAVYSPYFRTPYGLHPKHVVSIYGDLNVPRTMSHNYVQDEETGEFEDTMESATCGLYGYYILPSFIFVDKYQIADLADAQAGGVKRVVGIWGETDLEIPVWMVDKWGSTMLLELIPPSGEDLEAFTQQVDIEIPMHSRYEVPDWNTTAVVHDMPWPLIFWACDGSDENSMTMGPFDNNGLGLEKYFDPGTSFHYLTPNMTISSPDAHTELITELSIPVVPLESYKYVQPWTVVVILVGCFWIIYKAICGYVRDGGIRKKVEGVAPASQEEVEKKKQEPKSE